jgi:cytidine deaminase
METLDLIKLARDAREKAHAPYSNFKVGAALLAKDGQVFTGCNIENASYGDAICAEKVAVIKAISEGVSNFSKLVVFTDAEKPSSPCGSCRQILFEFNPELLVIMANSKGDKVEMKINELLPYAFSLKHGNKLF